MFTQSRWIKALTDIFGCCSIWKRLGPFQSLFRLRTWNQNSCLYQPPAIWGIHMWTPKKTSKWFSTWLWASLWTNCLWKFGIAFLRENFVGTYFGTWKCEYMFLNFHLMVMLYDIFYVTVESIHSWLRCYFMVTLQEYFLREREAHCVPKWWGNVSFSIHFYFSVVLVYCVYPKNGSCSLLCLCILFLIYIESS